MEAEKDPIKAIREHVLTAERNRRNDVVTLTGTREGVEFRTLSYLDVLLEGDTITQEQYGLGKIYWTLRDCAFHNLQCKVGKYDYRPEEEDRLLEAVCEMGLADTCAATEIFMSLNKLLARRHRDILSACCTTLESAYLPYKMWVYHAFGEGHLALAFRELEEKYQPAKTDAEKRMAEAEESACNAF